MKKFFAVLLAIMMMVAMVSSAMADVTVTMTNNDTAVGAEYAAYKLLNASISGTNYVYTVNPTYASAINDALGLTDPTDEDVVAAIADMSATDLRAFADEVYQAIKSMTMTADATDTDGVFSLEQGYYMIVETNPGTIEYADGAIPGIVEGTEEDQAGTYSLVMLKTAGEENITVTTKDSAPTLKKQIMHNELGTWGLVGDNQIGDTVEFRTITTVPGNTGFFETYVYKIHDTMSVGLTSNVAAASDVTIKVNDATTLAADYYSVTAEGNTFTIAIDVKRAVADGEMAPGDELYSYYTGTLNDEAKYAKTDKQDNEAYLEYSNNPYDDTTTTTPHVKVYDWTFTFDVQKIDGMADGNPELDGAKFVLAKAALTAVPTLGTSGEPNATTGLIPLVKVDDNTYRIATAAEITAGDTTYVIEIGHATIKGLDDATTYYMYEVEAPAGYNKLSDPVTFKIAADYSDDGATCTTLNITGPDDVNGDEFGGDIENRSGSELPETGSIGTTIFYVLGGLLVVAAVVLLVTRRRMANN